MCARVFARALVSVGQLTPSTLPLPSSSPSCVRLAKQEYLVVRLQNSRDMDMVQQAIGNFIDDEAHAKSVYDW